MLTRLCLAAALAVSSALSAQTSSPADNAAIEVMVLGTYHMSNPGHDAVNMHVDDVLQPGHQLELEHLAKQLERFQPTKVAVEARAAAPSYIWKSALNPLDLKTKSNENYQIGERVALRRGLDEVYGIDNDGDFDLDAVKKLDDRITGGTRMKAIVAGIQQLGHEGDQKQHTLTISQSMAWMNSPQAIKQNHDFYMNLLTISDGDDQPAAKLDAEWYERNLRIWGKVLQIAKPGDRILMIIGQGHAFWIRAFAQQTPGYKLVDPLSYLARQ